MIAIYQFTRPNQTYLILSTEPIPKSPHGTFDNLGRLLISPVITASAILQLYFILHLWLFADVGEDVVGLEGWKGCESWRLEGKKALNEASRMFACLSVYAILCCYDVRSLCSVL